MNSSVERERRVRGRRILGLIAAALFLLVATLPWLSYQDHAHWRNVGWVPFIPSHIRLPDIIANLLLGAPIGWFSGRLARGRRGLLLAAGVALPISLGAEWMQVYSHGRFPSATDVVCNVAGTLIGVGLVRVSLRGQ